VDVGWQSGLGLSADGRFLVWAVADETVKYKDANQPNAIITGNRLKMLDLTTGKLIERFGGFEGDANDQFFTADGKTLVTARSPRRDGAVLGRGNGQGRAVVPCQRPGQYTSGTRACRPTERCWR